MSSSHIPHLGTIFRLLVKCLFPVDPASLKADSLDTTLRHSPPSHHRGCGMGVYLTYWALGMCLLLELSSMGLWLGRIIPKHNLVG